MFNKRKIVHKIKHEISAKWLTCLIGLFFVVAGFLAGIYTADIYTDAARGEILQRLMGLGEGSTFWGRLLKLLWYRFISCFAIGVLSLYPILAPLSVLALILAAAFWSIGWGCVFSFCSKWTVLLSMPLFFLLILLHCLTFLYFYFRMLAYVKRSIFERNVPKSSRDVLYEALAFMRECYKWFVFTALASLIEAAVLPVFYN